MPKKRTSPRRRLPNDYGQISRLERLHWFTSGPAIAGRFTPARAEAEEGEAPAQATVTVWQSWQEWTAFYSTVREQFLAERAGRFPGQVPACERIFQAMEAGHDPDAEVSRLAEERAANDPRRLLPAN